jgi:hypothetical protein
MFLHRDPGSDALLLSGIDEPALVLLRLIVPSADPEDDPNALDRLYSSPTGGEDEAFDREWRELVTSDLQDEFTAAQEVVLKDIASITRQPGMEGEQIRIPREHLDAWINTLNQARLTLAARHQFTEREMESSPRESDPNAFVLMQVHFYGLLQERFIYEIAE